MIDFIYSKISLMIAALVITSVLLAVFAYQQREMDTISLNTVSENISSLVNQVSTSDSEVRWLVTFNEEKRSNGTYFPAMVGGDPYDLRIYSGGVFLDQEDKSSNSLFTSMVHTWNPGDMNNATSADLLRANNEISALEFQSGNDFYIESRYVSGSGYETFIYLVDSESFQKEINVKGNELNDFYQIKDQDQIEDSEVKYFELDFTAHPGTIIFNEDSEYKSLYLVNIDHVWNPSQINEPTTMTELHEFDDEASSIFISGSFTVERKTVRILDDNGVEHSVVRNFLYT